MNIKKSTWGLNIRNINSASYSMKRKTLKKIEKIDWQQ